MASKKASKGKRYTSKRYTTDEKQAVVDFVNNHNAEKGRGGVAAAVKKFGASALTIASWVKAGPGAGAKSSKGRGASSGSAFSSKRGNVLSELSKLDGIIAAKRKELDALESRFQKLKASL